MPPPDRRRFLLAGAGGLVAAALGRADDPPGGTNLVTAEAEQAVAAGLRWLARSQNDDGSFGDRGYSHNVAVTGLAGLAFMAGGHQPGRGEFGPNIVKALRYVLSKENKTATPGFLHAGPNTTSHGPMYDHGFGTLFLGELHGMIGDRELRQQLRQTLGRAVQVIVGSQNPEGGWRYDPVPVYADLSVTICQIMALRSARNAGLAVPTKVVEECIKYVKACQNADGGFSYFRQSGPQERRPSGFARSAAGVVALYSAGIYTGPEIDRGLHYLMQFKPGSGGFRRPDGPEAHYYYGQYYAAQAMWTAGGQFWAEWFPAIRDELLTRSRAARGYGGAWTDITTSDHYATAMACIILQIPNNYLPILQK